MDIYNKRIESFYDRFSPFYFLVDTFLMYGKRRLIYELNQHPAGRILEIGVGSGRYLSEYKNHEVVGIDLSSKMLSIASKRSKGELKLIKMDAKNLLFEDSAFDYVVISHMLSVTNDHEKVLCESYRVLKSNGKLFILNHFTPDNFLGKGDRLFQCISKLFFFSSAFYFKDLKLSSGFFQVKDMYLSRLRYVKLLVYSKK